VPLGNCCPSRGVCGIIPGEADYHDDEVVSMKPEDALIRTLTRNGRRYDCVVRFTPGGVEVETSSDGTPLASRVFTNGTEATAWAEEEREDWEHARTDVARRVRCGPSQLTRRGRVSQARVAASNVSEKAGHRSGGRVKESTVANPTVPVSSSAP
jgi:hypothetical protein